MGKRAAVEQLADRRRFSCDRISCRCTSWQDKRSKLVKEWSEKVDSVFELLNVAKVALGERQVDSAFNGWIDDEGNLDKSRILGKERTKA